jgi:hypothetical protein
VHTVQKASHVLVAWKELRGVNILRSSAADCRGYHRMPTSACPLQSLGEDPVPSMVDKHNLDEIHFLAVTGYQYSEGVFV